MRERARQKPVKPVAPVAAWDPVWSGVSEAEAIVVAGGLQAAGFRARAVGSPNRSTAYGSALGDSWAVVVPLAEADNARDLLASQGDTGVMEYESEEELTSDQRATLRAALIALVYLGIPALVLGLVYGVLSR